MNRRAVGNVKVDFHLVRFSRTRNLSKGHASDCQTGAPYECVEYEMTPSAPVGVFYKEGFCLLYRKKLTLSCFNIDTHLRL